MEPLLLETGAKYRGHIVVDSPFEPSKSTIAKALEGIGFADVEVWNDPRDLPEEWPEEDKQEADDFLVYTYWAEGVWEGEDGQQAVTSGDNWTMAWMRRVDLPGQEQEEEQERYEQEVPSAKWGWVPIVTSSLVNTFAVWLWIRASKE